MRNTNVVVYLVALSLLIAGASIAPRNVDLYSRKEVELCSVLAEKLPCEEASGSWSYICKASISVSCNSVAYAVHLSRHLPEHIYVFLMTVSSAEKQEQFQGMVRILGAFLGMSLLLLGRLLYMPCLFYLPAILLGYASIAPLQPFLEEKVGFSETHTRVLGSTLAVLLAHLQRTIFVRLLGLLMGILTFIMILVGTNFLTDMPFEGVIALGVTAGLSGSVLMLYIERTSLWKVVACSLVGSILLTDAIGLSQLSSVLQVAVCSCLVTTSCWRQLFPPPRKSRERKKEKEKEKEKDRRRTIGSILTPAKKPTKKADKAQGGRRSLSALLLSPRKNDTTDSELTSDGVEADSEATDSEVESKPREAKQQPKPTRGLGAQALGVTGNVLWYSGKAVWWLGKGAVSLVFGGREAERKQKKD